MATHPIICGDEKDLDNGYLENKANEGKIFEVTPLKSAGTRIVTVIAATLTRFCIASWQLL